MKLIISSLLAMLVCWQFVMRSVPATEPAKDFCALQLTFQEGDKPIPETTKVQLVPNDAKGIALPLTCSTPGVYTIRKIPTGVWKLQFTCEAGADREGFFPIATHNTLHFTRPGEYTLQGTITSDPKRLGLRRVWLTLQDAPLGADVLPSEPNRKQKGLPITIHVFLAQDAGDPARVATQLDLSQIGYPNDAERKLLRTWTSDKFGKAAIDGLPTGQHILIAQADAANATIVPVSVPQMRGEQFKQLRALPKWASDSKLPSPEVTAIAEGEGENERVRVTIRNRTDRPYPISEYDFQLSSTALRVFPNRMADGQFPGDTVNTIRALASPRENIEEIPPGKSYEFTLNWPDLVRQGLWIVRHEPIDESLLSKNVNKQAFRVRGSMPVWLTNPEEILKNSISLDVSLRNAVGQPLRDSLQLHYAGKSDHANRVALLQPRLDQPGVFQRVYLPVDRGWQISTYRAGTQPVSSSESFALEKPGHYALELQTQPVKNGVAPQELRVIVKQTPEGVTVTPMRGERPEVAAPNADQPNLQPDAVPLPEKTPFDTYEWARKMYLEGFRNGYLWATDPQRHAHCLTNPSDDNGPAIRGIIDGWRTGVPAAKGTPGDLPAKYALFIVPNVRGKKGGGGFMNGPAPAKIPITIEARTLDGKVHQLAGVDAILHCILNRDDKNLESLLAEGHDLNKPLGETGWTLLHHAARQGTLKSVNLLIKHGADRNARAGDQTPLDLARKAERPDVVKALEEKK